MAPEEVELEEKIGEGSYGQVFRGKFRGQLVAIKCFQAQTIAASLQNFFHELSLLRFEYDGYDGLPAAVLCCMEFSWVWIELLTLIDLPIKLSSSS